MLDLQGLTLGQRPVLGADARAQQAIVEARGGVLCNERVHAVLRVEKHGAHACTQLLDQDFSSGQWRLLILFCTPPAFTLYMREKNPLSLLPRGYG